VAQWLVRSSMVLGIVDCHVGFAVNKHRVFGFLGVLPFPPTFLIIQSSSIRSKSKLPKVLKIKFKTQIQVRPTIKVILFLDGAVIDSKTGKKPFKNGDTLTNTHTIRKIKLNVCNRFKRAIKRHQN